MALSRGVLLFTFVAVVGHVLAAEYYAYDDSTEEASLELEVLRASVKNPCTVPGVCPDPCFPVCHHSGGEAGCMPLCDVTGNKEKCVMRDNDRALCIKSDG